MKRILSLWMISLMPILLAAQDYQEVKISDLPSPVATYVSNQMPGGTIVRAAKGTSEGKTVYAAVIDFNGSKRIMIFDEKGQFLKRVESLTGGDKANQTRNDGPDPTNTSNTTPHPPLAPTTYLNESQIPASILSYLKTHLKDYKILEAKHMAMGETPIYQLIIRDKTHDYVYFFNGQGAFTNKRSYLQKNSPFRYQFPLAGSSDEVTTPASGEKK